ncbi:hypothetical protein FOZ62_001669 [Perkinsus olseni]|uniref:Uncharacterized protein n=1 Tax=Perkinsus olseni TaxID=32597 RepID=A0A7J6TSU8_PEROL|nr:hypothetical protein FOZ62_001669 [Perkinsus olseni]
MAARNASDWPASSVTIEDDSTCMSYDDAFNYNSEALVNATTAGDNHRCLAELIDGTTKAMRGLGVDPFLAGQALSSWVGYQGELVPWVSSAEAAIAREQCEEVFHKLHAVNSTLESILMAFQTALPSGFDVSSFVKGEVRDIANVRACDLAEFRVGFNSNRARCTANFSMFFHAVKHPGRCACPEVPPGQEPLMCLDHRPKHCVRAKAVYPLSWTYLAGHAHRSAIRCLEEVPGEIFKGWSAVWTVDESLQAWWIKTVISILFLLNTTVLLLVRFRRRASSQSPRDEVKFAE